MSGHTPTVEQSNVVDAFGFGADLVVQARAGSGKTSTLKMLAASTPERGVYLAYNKAIATDAARDFPARVVCKTAHALAFGAVGKRYAARLTGPRVPARETARLLRITQPVQYATDRAPLHPYQLARLAMETVRRYCYSADAEIGREHVPYVTGLSQPAERAMLRDVLVPIARRAWDDLQLVDRALKFDHDVYLKMWCLSRPQLGADYVMLDEAQDANPAVAALVTGQHAQRVLVGDACQSIYGWRGAVDAMSTFDGQQLHLSQSFRFGPQIAHEANKWLTLLRAEPLVTGLPSIPSTVGPAAAPDAILCRSNAGAVARAIGVMDGGRSAALVGGAADFKKMAEAALTLKQGMGCSHPELFVFRTWSEVKEYVELDSSGSDLRVFVDLIDKYGASEVMQVCERLVDEGKAEVVISTAHKAKGREWASVTIASDFREPKDDPAGYPGEVTREDAMLAYVAVTRARLQLDREGLAWVDRHVRWLIEHLPAVEQHAAEREQEYQPQVITSTQGRAVDAVADDAPEPLPALAGYDLPVVDTSVADHQPGDRVLYAGAIYTVLTVEPASVVPGWMYRVEDRVGFRSWVHSRNLTAAPEPDLEPVAECVGYVVGDGDHDPAGRLLSPDCYRCREPYQDCTCSVMPDRRPLEVSRA